MPSLGGTAYDALLDKIAMRELRPGEHLVERALAAELGVSRTPLREALRKLAAQGLVQETRHRGCFVSKRSLEDVGQMCEVREAMEGMAARLWAQRASTEALQQLEETTARVVESARTGALADYYHHDFVFHRQLILLCDNPYLSHFANAEALILNSFINTPVLSFAPEAPWSADASLQQVLAAIQARKPGRAERTVRRHIQSFHEAVKRLAVSAEARVAAK